MSTSVTMPQLGETVAEGTVTRWLIKVGDRIEAEEPLLEVSTDKVDTEVSAPVSGVLTQIFVGENETVPVGTVLATLGLATQADLAMVGAPGPLASVVTAAPAMPATVFASRATSDRVHRRHEFTPRVRHAASQLHVDLSTVRGTGPGGRVTAPDVAAAARATENLSAQSMTADAGVTLAPPASSSHAPIAGGGLREPMSRLRTVIADRMMTSLHTTAQLTTVVEVDVTRVVDIRERHKRTVEDTTGSKLTLTAIFAKAVVEVLRSFPLFNAALDGDGQTIVHRSEIRLGIAADTSRGLLVPVVASAGDLSLLGLTRAIGDLASRARSGGLTPDEMSGATFTLTNTGSRGALFDTPILGPQQVGILGIGAVVERPVVVKKADGERVITIRSMAYFALTYDHRLIDGADAARFLSALKTRLESDFSDSDVA